MSDWDFLHDMHHEGYSPGEIADATAVGYAPWQAKYIDFGDGHKKALQKAPVAPSAQIAKALQGIEQLRQSGVLSTQFLACKESILK